MTAPPRVVFDTNIVLSALVFAQGRLAVLRSMWQGARCVPLVSKVTVAELVRVLAYPKFRLTSAEQAELLGDYLPYCATVRMPKKLPKTPPYRDPCDAPFLQLGVAGKAKFLVTGDRDLLAVSEKSSCKIVTAEPFVSRVGVF